MNGHPVDQELSLRNSRLFKYDSRTSTWHDHPVARGGEVEALRKRSDKALPCRLNRQRATFPELPSSTGERSLLFRRERLSLKFRE